MSEIDLQVGDGIAVLTLDAPRRRNSLTVAMSAELIAACDVIDANASIGATIIRSTGTVFCAGADRELLARVGADPSLEGNYDGLTTVYESFGRVGRLTTPTITVVQGAALGAGLNLALSGDLCLVADDARLLSGFLPIGAHPGGGHFTLLAHRAGPQVAAALGLFGTKLVGAAAVRAGLAFEALPADQLDTRARELALVAASDPQLSRRATESMRIELGLSAAQQIGTRLEHAAQMWSLKRRNPR